MDVIPRRISLIDQVVEVLQREIVQGTWTEWLPNERALCEMLHVSRNTLRAALADLTRRRMIEPCYPRGTRILVMPDAKPRGGATGTVGLLSPQPIELLRPNVALIIDALRAKLAEIGCRLHLYHGERYGAPRSERALEKLAAAHRHDCWLLLLANDEVKRWFCHRGLPCVVSGSCAPDVPLPFVDLDYRALGRHAAGRVIAAGHRRIGIFIERSTITGKLECERGFREGAQQAGPPGIDARVFFYDGTAVSAVRALQNILSGAKRPTALLVVNPNYYLLALTFLQKKGVRVPEDISLVCADDDPFLSFVHPVPSRYGFDAHAFARRLFDLIRRVSNGQAVTRREVRIIPHYEKGATLGAPAGGTAR